MTFTLKCKQKDVRYMLMVIVALSLVLILTVVSDTQQKYDICQVLKQNPFSNLTASQKHFTEIYDQSNRQILILLIVLSEIQAIKKV